MLHRLVSTNEETTEHFSMNRSMNPTHLMAGQSVFNGATMYPPSSIMRVVFFVITILSSTNEVAGLITIHDPSLYMVISDNSNGALVGRSLVVGRGVIRSPPVTGASVFSIDSIGEGDG